MRRSLATTLVFAAVSAGAIAAVNAVVLVGGHGAEAVAPADLVVVPAARVHAGGRPSIALCDRLDRAIELYREGKARRILVSGNDGPSANREPTVMRAYLEARGVPREDVLFDPSGFDTYSAMWRARHAFGADHVIVVTQSFHLGRAVFLARAVGLNAEGARSDQHAYRGLAKDHVREVAARVKAALDVAIRRRPAGGEAV